MYAPNVYMVFMDRIVVCTVCGWSPAFNPAWDPHAKVPRTCHNHGAVVGTFRGLTDAEEAMIHLGGILALRDVAPGWTGEVRSGIVPTRWGMKL